MAENNPFLIGGLPPEYQDEVQKLMRQRQMAQAMQQQALSRMNQPTQFSGGYAVKQSPLANIANIAAAYMGNKQISEADTGITGAMKRYGDETQNEMMGLTTATDVPTALQKARASKNPQVRAMAEMMIKQRAEQAKEAAGVLKDTDPAAALGAIRDQSVPGANYSLPAPGPVQPGKLGDSDYLIVPQPGGKRDLKFAPKGQTINIDAKQAGREQEMALDSTKADLKKREENAEAAKQTLFSTRTALEAINEGAKSGGLEGYKLAAKKVLQGFGVATDNLTSTEELSMALGNQVLAKARALAPVTQADVDQLKSILGSVSTDPTALQKMLAITQGIAMKELQDFQRYTDSQAGAMKDPMAQALFTGSQIGREMMPPAGDIGQQLRAIQELQKRGGNVTNFAVGGEQIPPDARFDIRGPKPSATTGGPTMTLEEYYRKMMGK